MNSPHVLLIEPDELNCTRLQRALEQAGLEVSPVPDCATGQKLARQRRLGLVILAPPRVDGERWAVCRGWRRENDVPLLLLLDQAEAVERIVGLELGADDVLTRPFSPREVAARAGAILRRTAPNCSLRASGCLRHPGLCLDARRGEAQIEGQKVHLTPREFDLLWHLARSPNRIFSREELLDTVWKDEGDHYLHTVNSTIERLRQKLRPFRPQAWEIKTVRGQGYQFHLKL